MLCAEYCSQGSLYDCLAAAREQPAAAAQLTWRRRLGMAIDAGAGLLYLHRRNIIHRDGELLALSFWATCCNAAPYLCCPMQQIIGWMPAVEFATRVEPAVPCYMSLCCPTVPQSRAPTWSSTRTGM